MYGKAVSERVAAARFGGELEDATSTAERSNPICGDVVRIAIRRSGNGLTARWKAIGCPPTPAAADVVCELAETGVIPSIDDVLARLPDLPATSRHAAQLAVETLRAALG